MNRTNIQWTDFTANPIRYKNADGLNVWACSKVSAGCTNCYAETLALSPRMVGKGRALGNKFNDAEMAKLTPYLDEEILRKMLTFRPRGPFRNGERPMVFVGDMTDIFGEWVPDEWLDRLFAVFALRPDVTWQVLTKRPERMREYVANEAVVPRSYATGEPLGTPPVHRATMVLWRGQDSDLSRAAKKHLSGRFFTGDDDEIEMRWPLPNVWLGTSVEDQQAADTRIPELLATPAAVRFLSCEPLLSGLDLSKYLDDPSEWSAGGFVANTSISWLIAGGESGANARPCDLAWLRSLRDQCAAAGVPYFAKQVSKHPIENGIRLTMRDSHGGDINEFPEDLRIREFPNAL